MKKSSFFCLALFAEMNISRAEYRPAPDTYQPIFNTDMTPKMP